jgi:predicted metal-dependent enzyme (double-stranded beta helix superfamily)
MTTNTNITEVRSVQEPGHEPQKRVEVPDALKRFIWDIQSMVELEASEREILFIGRDLMRRLVASNGWLPEAFARPDPQRCQQFHLYYDDQERFTVVSTVLAGGQTLPIIQDQVWEITGVLHGTLERASFALSAEGKPQPKGAAGIMQPGAVDTRPGKSADAIQLRNGLSDEIAVAIHVYGGEISQLPRRIFALDGGVNEAPAVYANAPGAPPYDILSIQTRIVD